MSYPSQHRGDQPTGYAGYQPFEQPIEDSDEDSEESSDGSSDGYSDEDAERHLDRSLDEDYPRGPPGDHPVEHPVESYTHDRPEQPIEHPNRYLHRVSEALQAQGDYPTAGTASATQAFRSLRPTSFLPQPGPSQTDSSSQAAGAGCGDHQRPRFPDPDSNPHGPVAQTITGFEPPGFDPPYSSADDWWLRMSVANGFNLELVARSLKRTLASVENFVGWNNVAWTQKQDEQLGAMNVGEQSDMLFVRHRLAGSGNRRDDEILARAKYLEFRAANPQPGSQQHPTGLESAGPEAPRADRSSKPWNKRELEQLEKFVRRNGAKWRKMRNDEIPGRSIASCAEKWRDIERRGHRHLELQQFGEMSQPFLDNESDEEEQIRNRVEDLTDDDLNFIKIKLAQGDKMDDIVKYHYRGFRQRTIIKFVYFEGNWKPWTSKQDESLKRMLGPERVQWSEISNDFRDTPRSKEEIEARLGYLGQGKHGGRAPPYNFDEEDDEYMRLEAAKGVRYTQMHKDEFPDLKPASIGHHAKAIGASWDDADDHRLFTLNLEPGEIPDFEIVGQLWDPPRRPDLVELRWGFIHSDGYAPPRRRRGR